MKESEGFQLCTFILFQLTIITILEGSVVYLRKFYTIHERLVIKVFESSNKIACLKFK